MAESKLRRQGRSSIVAIYTENTTIAEILNSVFCWEFCARFETASPIRMEFVVNSSLFHYRFTGWRTLTLKSIRNDPRNQFCASKRSVHRSPFSNGTRRPTPESNGNFQFVEKEHIGKPQNQLHAAHPLEEDVFTHRCWINGVPVLGFSNIFFPTWSSELSLCVWFS